jgi:actin-related protein
MVDFKYRPIMIDSGSVTMKVDFAGEEVPKLVFLSVAGQPKTKNL